MGTSRPTKVLLLALALVPSCIVLVIAIYILLTGGKAQIHWHLTIWPLVAIQIASIAAFSRHARKNSALSSSQADNWVMQFIVFIPIGMLSYWDKHVRG